MDNDNNSASHSPGEDSDVTHPTKQARVATRVNPPQTRNPMMKKKQTRESKSIWISQLSKYSLHP